jgi:hypothetical protein
MQARPLGRNLMRLVIPQLLDNHLQQLGSQNDRMIEQANVYVALAGQAEGASNEHGLHEEKMSVMMLLLRMASNICTLIFWSGRYLLNFV